MAVSWAAAAIRAAASGVMAPSASFSATAGVHSSCAATLTALRAPARERFWSRRKISSACASPSRRAISPTRSASNAARDALARPTRRKRSRNSANSTPRSDTGDACHSASTAHSPIRSSPPLDVLRVVSDRSYHRLARHLLMTTHHIIVGVRQNNNRRMPLRSPDGFAFRSPRGPGSGVPAKPQVSGLSG